MNNINIEELPVGRKLLLVTIEENFSLDGYFFKEERYTLEKSEEGLSIYRHGITRRPMQWRKCQIPNNVIEMRRQFEFTADDPTHPGNSQTIVGSTVVEITESSLATDDMGREP